MKIAAISNYTLKNTNIQRIIREKSQIILQTPAILIQKK